MKCCLRASSLLLHIEYLSLLVESVCKTQELATKGLDRDLPRMELSNILAQ